MMGLTFFALQKSEMRSRRKDVLMKKLHLKSRERITFREGCNRYLDDCRSRNLREGTIGHYRQSYTQFYKYFDPDMLISELSEKSYNAYVVYLRENLQRDSSINSYLRDLITTFHFFMNSGWIDEFQMKSIKVDKTSVETYTDDELIRLLAKPDLKKCTFTSYQCWVMSSFLFSTGVRQRSLDNIKIKDVDFDNKLIYVNVTKNRKPLIVPMSNSLSDILKEYLSLRPHKSNDEFLFVNAFGEQLTKSTCYHMLYWYNKSRGVETTGIHRYRHTFARQWIINGGNVATLSRLLGHSSLQITQNYINLLSSDLAKEVEEINLLDKFRKNEKLKLNK